MACKTLSSRLSLRCVGRSYAELRSQASAQPLSGRVQAPFHRAQWALEYLRDSRLVHVQVVTQHHDRTLLGRKRIHGIEDTGTRIAYHRDFLGTRGDVGLL